VIDPVKMIKGRQAVMRKHKQCVEKLHRVMTSCKEEFFPQPRIGMTGWATDFLAVEGGAGNR
jgi:hypothetical protein